VGRGMAGVWRTGQRQARAGPGYGGDAVGRSAQVGFARPVSVRHVAMEDWVRTSVEGLGTGGRRGAPVVVPGQQAVRPGVAPSTTSRVGANAWRGI
jgi:hypothetical protein